MGDHLESREPAAIPMAGTYAGCGAFSRLEIETPRSPRGSGQAAAIVCVAVSQGPTPRRQVAKGDVNNEHHEASGCSNAFVRREAPLMRSARECQSSRLALLAIRVVRFWIPPASLRLGVLAWNVWAVPRTRSLPLGLSLLAILAFRSF